MIDNDTVDRPAAVTDAPARRIARHALAASAAIATLALAFNAVVYTATTATSVLISDSWYFVETFLMSYYQRGLTLASLLAKRSAVDHAVPVQKLVLLADAKWFGLDFRMEGLFSVFVALLTLGMFATWMKRARRFPQTHAWHLVALAAIASIYLSMNATVVFEWPLVSLYFVMLLIVFLFFACILEAMASGRYWLATLAGVACLLCADDIGLLALASAAAVVCLAWLRREIPRTRALGVLVGLAISVIVGRALYAAYGSTFPEAASMSVMARLSAVMALGPGGLAEAGIIIASAPIAHRSQLPVGQGGGVQAIQVAIAVAMLVLHAWFWWSQWKCLPSFLARFAAALMVLAYLMAAGIVYGRVSQLGVDYLNAPRYVQFFGLALVAIVLQLFVVVVARGAGEGRLGKAMLLGLAIGLVGLQVVYARNAWQRAPFAAEYERRLALQIGEAADPRNAQAITCLPQIVICKRPYAGRSAVLDFLQAHRMNVFSPRIQHLRRLYPAGTEPPP